jgi:PII-like signaling protein
MTGPVKMLVVFVNEVDRIGDEPLYEVVMRRLRKRDVAGATALHGVMGFGQHHRMHHKGLFGIADDRPITITVVDTEARVRGLLPELRSLVPSAPMLILDAEFVPPSQTMAV